MVPMCPLFGGFTVFIFYGLHNHIKMTDHSQGSYVLMHSSTTVILHANPIKPCLRVQTTYVMLCPFAAHAQLFYLDRPRNTHTLYLQNRSKRRHAAMAYVCVQLYKSTTYSKKEKNTKNSVIFTPTIPFFSKKKFISATAQLSTAESSSKGVFRRVLHHNIEFLSISTLIFYIHVHTLSTTFF